VDLVVARVFENTLSTHGECAFLYEQYIPHREYSPGTVGGSGEASDHDIDS
jgi:hypothetical protein